ncbi:FimV/HubP family polar landmark protein [Halopseudomonas sp.]|jgi:pilus assembly protein FimV|uniref:FimV/HubP family polar landmark protein n=1 Tax=Halopseudomonas sp. TaxID=2901191 RepID=UPI0039E48FAE
MVRKLVLAVAAASALMSSNMTLALGVGDINLRSALNQPLDAEIELLQVKDLTSQEILPNLASPDEFGRAGIERDFFLNDLVFTPVIRPDGRAVIRVTSSKPVKEPFLNFLMEVRWPSGRVLREFTLLLDPPLYSPTPVTASAPATQAWRAPVEPVQRPVPTVAAAQPRDTQPRPQSPAPASARPSSEQATGEWRTSRTDTLWEIALRSRPSDASVHQTMLAIQELNPNAFIDNNINRLKANQTLTLPDADQARRLGQADAVAQVAAQNSAWKGGQRAEPAQRQLDARQQDAAPAAPETAPDGDSLRLVAGSAEQGEGASESASTDSASRLRDQLDETKEQLDSLEREKAEADSRLTAMQAQMDTLQRLLELKDAQLAAMQEQLGDSAELPDIAPEPADDASAADVVAGESAQDSELPAVDESGLPAEQMDAPADSLAEMPEDTETPIELDAPVADDSGEVTSQADTAAAELSPSAAPAPETPAAESNGQSPVVVDAEQDGVEALLQRMMQNQTFLIVGGGIILLLILLLLMALARRNARRESEMADNFIARAAESGEGDESGDADEFNVALAGFDEESQELGISHDPITEADALIAYGKLAEAAEVLNAAIEVEPARTDLRFKLMEVEGLLDNREGYAEQMTALRDMGAPEPQIAAMNARFPVMAALVAGAAVADAETVFERDEPETIEYNVGGFESEVPAADAAPVAAESEHDDLDLDFDLDDSLAKDLADPGVAAPSSQAAEDEFELDFNLDESSQPAKAETESDFTLDEDFDLSLTDDLQADSLMAEMDAMGQSDAKTPTDAEPSETSFDLSDEELMRFEEELNEAENEEAGFAQSGVESDAPSRNLTSDDASFESDELNDPQLDDEDEIDALPSSTAEQALADSMAEDDEDEFDFLSGTDECATKLDLARAYIDMGDQEGARDILGEVLEEGNDQQKQDARDMMEQLD